MLINKRSKIVEDGAGQAECVREKQRETFHVENPLSDLQHLLVFFLIFMLFNNLRYNIVYLLTFSFLYRLFFHLDLINTKLRFDFVVTELLKCAHNVIRSQNRGIFNTCLF